MKAAAENYKGIKYVRISSLPLEQKDRIWKTIDCNRVIKILMGDSLLNDCLQYEHYIAWYENFYSIKEKPVEVYPSTAENLAIAS
ncbi:MAG: hypothetical protein JST48_11805 [Bacteroidetes bacterium]|nr:hypothetical protein [Bacteroidota bacterium]